MRCVWEDNVKGTQINCVWRYWLDWKGSVWDPVGGILWNLEVHIIREFPDLLNDPGPGVTYLLRRCATSRRVSGSIPSGVAGDFSVATDGTMCPGVDSASRNEYQGNSWGEGGRCVRLKTLHLHSAERHETRSLNLPDPRRVCSGL
jgi:hypothetical protein